MAGHTEGLHDGHKALIEFAKSLGDVTVEITRNLGERNAFLIHGRKYVQNQDVSKQFADIDELGVRIIILPQIIVSEKTRLRAEYRARKILYPLKEKLVLKRYQQYVGASIIASFLTDRRRQYDLVVRGPEVPLFFLSSISKGMKWIESRFFNRIIKSKDGIKLSWPFLRGSMRKEDLKLEDSTFFGPGFIPGMIRVNSYRTKENMLIEDVTFWGGRKKAKP
jgi:glycerol-3-phosphate cytidylyltransferase-like family protein